jgi:hypothetical protein
MLRLILSLTSIFYVFFAFAQEDQYFDDNYIRYDDYTYNQNYKSVKFTRTASDYSVPIIELGSGGTLTLSFDDLSVGSETYYYTFILCNADWTPADILPMEYIDGMNEEYFNSNYASYNTTIRFTHYVVNLPSQNIRLTKAGNYLLKVYPEGEPDNPIITRRMYVVENKVGVEADYFIAKSPQYRDTKQEMYVKVNLQSYPMPNIYEDFTMVIQQNNRKDNMIVRHKPKVMTNEYLYFNLNGDILFDGGNEFRMFDIRSLKTQSARINTIRYDSAGYQVDLLTDISRAKNNYLKYEDLNGDFALINWDDPQLSTQIESDYAFVNFSFKLDSVLKDGGLYLLGGMTNWRLDSDSRLAYDRLTGRYTTTLLLKQGVYNYQYVYLPNGAKEANVSDFEGNHSETVNKYTIFIYYRDQGQFWDRLIGYKTLQIN